MSFRTKLLKALMDYETFDSYGSNVLKRYLTGTADPKQSSPEWEVFKTLKGYVKSSKQSVDVDTLEKLHMPTIDDSRELILKPIQELFTDLRETQVDESVTYCLQQCKVATLAEGLSKDLAKLEIKPDAERMYALLQEVSDNIGIKDEEDKLKLKDPEEAFKQFESLNEFEWDCPKFNMMAGGFGRGRSCLLFALSNMGKSSFTIKNIAKWLKDGQRVLDVSIAEDTEARRIPHIIQTLYDIDRNTLAENYQEYYTQFYNEYKDQYAFLYNVAGTNVATLKKYVTDFEPDIVIADGFGKLSKGKSDVNHAKLLGLISADLKSLAEDKGFGLICVCQAAQTARGKQILGMNDIADSKVDLAGEFEIITGIGCNSDEPNKSQNRWVNFSKSKLGSEGQIMYTFLKETNEWKTVG